MSPFVERIDSDETLPASADVVIVGGGIVGVTAAYFLARRGISVALIEKGHVACEQSSRNWGWCRQQNRDARELPLSSVAMRLWDEFSNDLEHDVGFRRCGLVYATDNEAQLAGWSDWQPYGLDHGVDTRLLSAEEVRKPKRGASGSAASPPPTMGRPNPPSPGPRSPWARGHTVPPFIRTAPPAGSTSRMAGSSACIRKKG